MRRGSHLQERDTPDPEHCQVLSSIYNEYMTVCTALPHFNVKFNKMLWASWSPVTSTVWIFSNRTGKICNFKRLHLYIYLMPNVLLKSTKPNLPVFFPRAASTTQVGVLSSFQVGYYSVRDRPLVATQRPAPRSAQLPEQRENTSWKHKRPPKLRPWTKQVKEPLWAYEPSGMSLLWDAEKAFLFDPRIPLSWTVGLILVTMKYFLISFTFTVKIP